MNLLHGTLQHTAAGYGVQLGTDMVQLPHVSPQLMQFVGKPIIFGVRPEHITDSSRGYEGGQAFTLPVLVTEPTAALPKKCCAG